MTNEQIKAQIDYNNKTIENMLSPNFFTLNNTVAALLKENEQLQNKCNHQFKNGYCIWCYKREEY